MPTKKRCENGDCTNEYVDRSDKTCTPQPFCSVCTKLMAHVQVPYIDGSGDEYEEDY